MASLIVFFVDWCERLLGFTRLRAKAVRNHVICLGAIRVLGRPALPLLLQIFRAELLEY